MRVTFSCFLTLMNITKINSMKTTIHYAFILDQSGSMHGLKNEVITSFNEQVKSINKVIKSNPGTKIYFTFCIFNEEIEFKFITQEVNKLLKLKAHEYNPDSCTALYDAIGLTYRKIQKEVKNNDKVFIAVFTDGLENASTDFTSKDIKGLLSQAEEKNWEIRFFCRQEENLFYKSNLGISDKQMLNISLNESGLKVMESEISFCLGEMVKPKKLS